MIEGKYILDTISDLYHENHMTNFMRLSYEYCQQHENEIRAHIAKAEASI